MSSKVFFGLLLVIIGGGFFLNQLGFVDFLGIIKVYWPLIIVLFGVLEFLGPSKSKTGALFFVFTGLLLQMITKDVFSWSIWSYTWPLFLILIGLRILLPMDGKKSKNPGYFSYFKFFSFTKEVLPPAKFAGGRISALGAFTHIDLSELELADNNSKEIEINIILGSVKIKLPKNCRIEAKGLPIIGSWTDENLPDIEQNLPKLKIRYVLILGSFRLL